MWTLLRSLQGFHRPSLMKILQSCTFGQPADSTRSASSFSNSRIFKMCTAGERPPLPPIQTTLIHDKPIESSEPKPITPTAEEHALKSAVICPPAPRKPRPAKRKFTPTQQDFFPVSSDDLCSCFLALPKLPAKKTPSNVLSSAIIPFPSVQDHE